MERVSLSGVGIESAVTKATEVLRAGGVILYPTDTLYGLGADAFSDAAVAKIYAIKSREARKPIHCIVADMVMAERYAEVSDVARTLAQKFLPGPLTLVLPKKPEVTGGIASDAATLGIRIPANEFCLALAREAGPYTTTSANKSGAPSARRIDDILAQLGPAADMIDLVIDAGELPESLPSTVVDLTGGLPKVRREGAISASEILSVR